MTASCSRPVRVKVAKTGEERDMDANGLFYALATCLLPRSSRPGGLRQRRILITTQRHRSASVKGCLCRR